MTFLRAEPPTFEHHLLPFGIGESAPRLSWTVTTDIPGWTQQAYEIELSDGTCTGRVESPESVLLPWPGGELGSRERRAVRVRVHGRDGSAGDWSPWSWAETGLLDTADWQAGAAAPPLELLGPPDGPALLLRRDFTLHGPVDRARLYVTAHGLHETEINGRVVGDEVLAPGWTSYGHRLRYRTHDVTHLLREGANAVGATLADGWYRGRLGFRGGKSDVYGERTALIAQLEITYADGTTDIVVTDGTWQCAPGPVTAASLYEGEKYDARLLPAGWSRPGFDDATWLPADALPHDPALLVAPTGPQVRRVETLDSVETIIGPDGETILDFGQNISGRLRIRVQGPAGHTVTLRHAEVLENGALGVRPLRTALALDTYTLRGDCTAEVWEPRFTVHGFRYAQIDGWPGELDLAAVQAVVCHTDMRRTGDFTCSDPLLTRLHDNVVWSMRGNFVDIPTDCPQRDERLGWTGDIQVFGPAAAFLYDCAGMLSSWLQDLAAEQRQYGTVPLYVPWVDLGPFTNDEPTAVWGDAAVVLPWTLYRRTGDLDVLRRQYPSMTAWVDQIAELVGESFLWDEGFQLGDWLDPTAPPDRPFDAQTDPGLVATAYLAYSARLLAETAALLGHAEDERRYQELAGRVRAAFDAAYVSLEGKVAGDSQTGYALALRFGLIDGAERRAHAGERLVELVRANGHRIGTGFVGTPLICDALAEAGACDDAYRLLLQTECPSWLYAVTMGATTVWERWDSMLPDGTINPGEMTSFNHYALGAVADWMHRTLAGLAPAAPGYRRMLVRPRPGGGLTHARATHVTPYGRAEVSWERSGGRLTLHVLVPPSTTATVHLPGEPDEPIEAGPGRHVFHCAFRNPADDPVSADGGIRRD
ncbi:glycoside hydrolase family 78 protein [Streptosporangium sp. NBC_01756]|uniref:glycoside hydrolase family 78 protein n=1 Tax=Streptosporangium sp. NBC_01756 TaxID=2975950 RepID=UPI002DD82FFB|nr:glycoside hydrolase family 78 protein [Streptosporangium sp. NBC_01756]WSC88400.1 glycoside hydrolase family 78 protein [Streptosporangium sp. NBC_01756]